MATLEALAPLDLLIWKRTGLEASRALFCNQSTVSRRIARAVDVFALELQRRQGEWQLRGGLWLLAIERQLHQLCRLAGREPLRLEISPLLAPLLAAPPPPGWLLGTFDHIGMGRPLQLLRERVIDDWLIDNLLDLPPQDDPEIRRFPVPQLPAEQFPRTSRRFSDLALHGHLRPLELEPLLWNGISLVCHRDLQEQAAIAALRELLVGRLGAQASNLAHLEPVV